MSARRRKNPRDEAFIRSLRFREHHSMDFGTGMLYIRISAFTPDGKKVGTARFHSPGGKRPLRSVMSETDFEHYRRGVMTAIYDQAERRFGRVEPGYQQTEAAKAFWRDRLSKRQNPNYAPPNATLTQRRRVLSGRIQGLCPRITSVQNHVRAIAMAARDMGSSFALDRLVIIQARLDDAIEHCAMASREVWS